MLLTNARIVLSDRVEFGSLVVEDGLISEILTSQPNASASESVIDLRGSTLLPGFIDLHIHGAIGVDVNSAAASDLQRVSQFLATKGVTSWLPTLVPAAADDYERAVTAIAESMAQPANAHSGHPGARVLGVHYEGPFVNSEQCGALHREHFRRFQTSADLDSLPTIENKAAVHMMTVAPEIEGGIELISQLRRGGWVVSIGHTRATPDTLDEAREAGANHMTHFMNAMSPLHHRAPGPVGWGLLNDNVSLDLIADGVHLDSMMLKVLVHCATPSRLALISDAIAATGQGDGDYDIWGEKITVEGGRTRNSSGNIAGSVISMLEAAQMMLSLGVSESDVARMGSLNPAHLLGIEKDCGSIELGKRADLVVIDVEGNVKLALVGGQPSYPGGI